MLDEYELIGSSILKVDFPLRPIKYILLKRKSMATGETNIMMHNKVAERLFEGREKLLIVNGKAGKYGRNVFYEG